MNQTGYGHTNTALNASSPRTQSSEGAPDATQELKREIKEFVKMIAWFLVLFLVLKTYVIESYEVQGPSMEPTLESNDRILIFKLPHIVSQWSPFRGYEALDPSDIVVFDSPDNAHKRYVKRIIAKGPPRSRSNTVDAQRAAGDAVFDTGVSIEVRDGVTYINNQRLDEPYVALDGSLDFDTMPRLILGPGEYFVMGDHRSVSKDSRSFRAVSEDRIIGKAVLRIWPLSKFGFLQ